MVPEQARDSLELLAALDVPRDGGHRALGGGTGVARGAGKVPLVASDQPLNFAREPPVDWVAVQPPAALRRREVGEVRGADGVKQPAGGLTGLDGRWIPWLALPGGREPAPGGQQWWLATPRTPSGAAHEGDGQS